MARTIVVGGGLVGLSAAHTVLERAQAENLSLGGHPAKFNFAINGARTQAQHMFAIEDSAQVLPALTRPDLIASLTANSASAIAWITGALNVDLSVVSPRRAHHPAHIATSPLGDHVRADEETHAARQGIPPPLASSRATALISSRSARQAATTHPGPRACPLRPFRRRCVRPRAGRPRSLRREDGFVPRVRDAGGLFLDARRARLGGGRKGRGDGGDAACRRRGAACAGGAGSEEVKEEVLLSKNLMKRHPDAAAFAEDTRIPVSRRLRVIGGRDAFGTVATTKSYTKSFCLAIITPVVHYTLGRRRRHHARHVFVLLHPPPTPRIRARPVGRGRSERQRTRTRAESPRGLVVSLLFEAWCLGGLRGRGGVKGRGEGSVVLRVGTSKYFLNLIFFFLSLTQLQVNNS
ncbi:hypothetical protein C8R45DRAFT_1182871 [Mycena sanguinolenta]|nr:hypothetical protein C8R45DRAFT_1182871 [Mycena sanguinolenta]